MRRVTCYECGKRYDYDDDGFCPKCGAFNVPASASRIGADGSVIWVNGLNERNHKNSFVHEELHDEDRERRKLNLDRDPVAEKVVRLSREGRPTVVTSGRRSGKKGGLGVALAILGIILFINIVLPLIFAMFSYW